MYKISVWFWGWFLMRKIIVLYLFGLLLVSCGPRQMFEFTEPPTPSATLIPTSAKTFTPTPSITPTPTSTNTPTPTLTSTPTLAPTLLGGASGRFVFELDEDSYKKSFPDLKGQYHVFTANLDGTNLAPVTRGLNGRTRLIDVSPDGDNALIVSTPPDPVTGDVYSLYVVSLNGVNSEPIEIAKMAQDHLRIWHREQVAKWIDNTRLIYVGEGEAGFGIYAVNSDGTDQKLIYKPEVLFDTHIPYQILTVDESRVYWTADVTLRREGNQHWSEERVWWSNLDGTEYERLEYNGEQIVADSLFFNSLAVSAERNKIAWRSKDWPFVIHIALIADNLSILDNYNEGMSNWTDLIWLGDTNLLVYDDIYYEYYKDYDNDDRVDWYGFFELDVSDQLQVRDLTSVGFELNCSNALYEVSPDREYLLVCPRLGRTRLLELGTMEFIEVLPGITLRKEYEIKWIP